MTDQSAAPALNKSPGFESADGWGTGFASAKGYGPGVVVGPGRNNPNIFAQNFPIEGGAQLKVTARAASVDDPQALAVIQINWMDASNSFLGVSMKSFPVAPSGESATLVAAAPANASYGTLYVVPGGREAVRYTEMRVSPLSPVSDFMVYRFFGVEGPWLAIFALVGAIIAIGFMFRGQLLRRDITDITYRPDVDGLRAVAIVLVLLFHAFPSIAAGGFIGVDVFFVISGFLISSIIFKGLDRGRFSFRTFYSRRIMRLFPALILVLGTSIALGWLTLLPDEYKQFGQHVMGSVAFMQNVVLWNEVGYFNTSSNEKPLRHLWSLGVEEQFYLLFPLIIWLAWRVRAVLFTTIAMLALASLAINLIRTGTHSEEAFFLPHTRFWELLAGAMLAYLHIFRQGLTSWRVPDWVLSAMGLALILVAVVLLDEKSKFPGWWALLPIAGSVLVIAAGPRAPFNGLVLASPLIVFIGLISYPLYLWHWPLLSWAYVIEAGTPSLQIRASAVALSVVLATLTYLLIEQPLRAYHNTRVKTAALSFCALVLAGLGLTIYFKDGIPSRVEEWHGVVPVSTFQWGDRFENAVCRQTYPSFKGHFCLMQKRQPPTIVLIGDSHSMALHAGIAHALANTHHNLLTIGDVGCIAAIDATLDSNGNKVNDAHHCRASMNDSISIAEHSSAGTVILSSYGGLALGNLSEQDFRGLAGAMHNTFRRLLARGKEVIFVVDIPQLFFDPKACVNIRPIAFTPRLSPCAVPRSYHDDLRLKYGTFVFSVLKEFPTIKVFDAAAPLCDTEWCWAMKGGTVLYVDPNHLTLEGSNLVGNQLVRLIANDPLGKAGERVLLQ